MQIMAKLVLCIFLLLLGACASGNRQVVQPVESKPSLEFKMHVRGVEDAQLVIDVLVINRSPGTLYLRLTSYGAVSPITLTFRDDEHNMRIPFPGFGSGTGPPKYIAVGGERKRLPRGLHVGTFVMGRLKVGHSMLESMTKGEFELYGYATVLKAGPTPESALETEKVAFELRARVDGPLPKLAPESP